MFVVTGASDGLGLELAKQLAGKGKKVLSLSRTAPADKSVGFVRCDLTDPTSVEEAARQILEVDEPLEALVNCAGVMSIEPAERITASEIQRVFATNVTGAVLLTSRLAERLKKDGGDLMNVSSTVGHKGYKDQAAYGSSKWAMRGLSENARIEFKDTSCRVISFCPGGFNSNILKKATGQGVADPENWMSAEELAKVMVQILELPKNMEVSEILINRRPATK